jgi:hypothetical protein
VKNIEEEKKNDNEQTFISKIIVDENLKNNLV